MVETPEERIIFAGELEAFGGAERSVLALARWLHDHDLPHRVLLYYDPIDLASYADFPLTVTVLNPARKAWAKIAALRGWFSQSGGALQPLASGIQPALHLAAGGHRGFHNLMHDTPSLLEADTPATLKRRVVRTVSDLVLARGLGSGGVTFVTSQYLAAECRRLYGGKVEIARMGGVGHANDPPKPMGSMLRLFSVSRLEANKRLDWILNSLKALEDASPALSQQVDWRFDVAGRGRDRDMLEALARELGLERRVTFHGFVDDAGLEALYAQADLFLMPARQGYGIPAIEALSRGLPVLLHRESGVSDILTDTPWAFVMDGGPDQLTPALDRAIRSVEAGGHLNTPKPDLPTEPRWAEQVAGGCGWLP